MSRFIRFAWRRRGVSSAVLVALVASTIVALGAFADAGNPVVNTIQASAVDNGNGTVTISIKGEWNWLSHGADCNGSGSGTRAGTGVGIIWNDPTEPGYAITNGSNVNLANSPNGATESGNTVTLTANGGGGTPWSAYTVGSGIDVSGVGVAGYNGDFFITGISGTHLTYTDTNITNAAASGSGTVQVGYSVGTSALRAGLRTSLSSASESGTTVTLTTSTANAFSTFKAGDTLVVNGVSVGGYNGTFKITGSPTGTTLQYSDTSGLGAGTGGTANDASLNNRLDKTIHPVDLGNIAHSLPGLAGQHWFDPTPDPTTGLGLVSQWLGGCGRDPVPAVNKIAITSATESGNTVTLTTASNAGFTVGDTTLQVSGVTPAGYDTPVTSPLSAFTVTAVSGNTIQYTDSVSGLGAGTKFGTVEGEPWGSFGYTTPPSGSYTQGFTHTYVKTYVNSSGKTVSGLPPEICDNFYDMHGQNAGFDAPPTDDITADNDNSIQQNDYNPANGENCVTLTPTTIATTATSASVGSPISDTATLSGVPKNVTGGTVTFTAYKRAGASAVCDPATVAFTSTMPVPTGTGSDLTIASGPSASNLAAGTYDWIASYTGTVNGTTIVTGSQGSCGDANETSTIIDANVQISPATANNQLGSPHVLTGHLNINNGTGFANAPAGSTINFAIVSRSRARSRRPAV